VFAKLTVGDHQDDGGLPNLIRCRLSAGVDFDRNFLTLDPAEDGTLALSVVHTFADAGNVVDSCAGAENASCAFLKVVTTRVSDLSNGPLTLIP
jgi:hypothetical protein